MSTSSSQQQTRGVGSPASKTSSSSSDAAERKQSKQSKPIKYLSWPTPNGLKVDILFEELKLVESDVVAERENVNISKDDQFKPTFLAVNPNNKIPAIHDPEAIGGGAMDLFESGAILLYLAEKSGHFFAYKDRQQYYEGLKWIFWQMAGVGPMFGQAGHFINAAPKDQKEAIAYGTKRYIDESMRLLGVLDKHLASQKSGYMWNGEYSIVDMILYPWIRSGVERLKLDVSKASSVSAWLDKIGSRPAVQNAYLQRDQILKAAL